MPTFRPVSATALFCACLCSLSACETAQTKSRPTARVIDRQGLQTVAVLSEYLFPPGWGEPTRLSIARRMYPLEYHGNESGGKTLIHSRVEFDAGALRLLLADIKRTTPSFTSTDDLETPAGDGGPGGRALHWWKPGKRADVTRYFWRTDGPNSTVTRIWLQAADQKRNVKEVYVRIEAE